MPGEAPDAPVHHFALVGRVCFETGQLEITHRLEEETDQPEGNAKEIKNCESVRSGTELGGQQGDGNDPHQPPLQQEDPEETLPPPVGTRFLAPGLIAIIFRLAPVPPQDVKRQPQSPDGDQRADQQFAGQEAIRR